MQKILFAAILSLSLMVCLSSCVAPTYSPRAHARGSGLDDASAGVAAANEGKYDDAIRLLTKAIASGELSQEELSRAYNSRGLSWDKKGDYDKAIADYSKAIMIDPKYVEAYNNRGSACDKKGDYDKAIADCSKAIELDPMYAEAYNNRGIAWAMKVDYDKAIVDFTTAIKINPKDANAYFNRGLARNKKGEHDKAKDDFDEAIEIDPELRQRKE
jgi:tetratricopeptide (TPR) repeat protein